jgi:hypothetical protein
MERTSGIIQCDFMVFVPKQAIHRKEITYFHVNRR